MVDRILKALFSLILGGMALLYVAHNIANWDKAHEFFVYTTSHANQEAYPVTLLPVPGEPLVIAAMLLVFALELAAALFLIGGAWKLWSARKADAAKFEQAKLWSKIGIGCAVANWWGLFQVIAVAGYQLWQMPLGAGPDHGSWVFGAMNMLVLLYLSRRVG
jgi:predicted small integral membrane protein